MATSKKKPEELPVALDEALVRLTMRAVDRAGGQVPAANQLGISQGHISAMKNGSARAGAKVLRALLNHDPRGVAGAFQSFAEVSASNSWQLYAVAHGLDPSREDVAAQLPPIFDDWKKRGDILETLTKGLIASQAEDTSDKQPAPRKKSKVASGTRVKDRSSAGRTAKSIREKG